MLGTGYMEFHEALLQCFRSVGILPFGGFRQLFGWQLL